MKQKISVILATIMVILSVPLEAMALEVNQETLSYSLPQEGWDPDAYDSINGSFSQEEDTYSFKIQIDQSISNACLITMDDQTSMYIYPEVYDSDNNRIYLPQITLSPAFRAYSIPDDLENGEYTVRIRPYYDYTMQNVSYKILYTAQTQLSYFTSGINTLSTLEYYNANSRANYNWYTLQDRDTEHWFKVHLTQGSTSNNIVTLIARNNFIDFTLRPIGNPNQIVYDSGLNPSITHRIDRAGSLFDTASIVKDDITPEVSGDYYLVVKPQTNVTNEEYVIYFGEPYIYRASVKIKGSPLTISRVNTEYTQSFTVNPSSTIPKTAQVNYISCVGLGDMGYAITSAKKRTEDAYHGGQQTWTYYYEEDYPKWKKDGRTCPKRRRNCQS